MLYDNALMLKVFTKAYLSYDDSSYKEVALDTAEFVNNFMQEDFLYYSASDADSGNEEGLYFLYEWDEVKNELEKNGFEDVEDILEALSFTKEGNFEGKNIVRIKEEKPKNFKEIKRILQLIRAKREYPFIDKKIQTSWSGMYIDALFDLSVIEPKYKEIAINSLQKLLDTLYVDGVLYHTCMPGKPPKVKAFLEDYAFLAKALLNGYEKTFDETYIIKAQVLINEALSEFYDKGVWFFSKGDFATKAEVYDATYTSSISIMIENLLSISALLDDEKYRTFAFKTLEYNSYDLARKPVYYPYMFNQMMRYLKEDIIIKSNRENLLNNLYEILKLSYPYILIKSQEELVKFLICGIKSCYEEVEDIKKITKI
jgi:uncharacterized protein YyaL (SSP411 family)